MKILFADTFPERWLSHLSSRGHETRYQPDLGAGDLAAALGDAEVLVVRSTKVAGAVLEDGGLRLVVRAGAGTNTIDSDRAREKGVAVCNTPGRNAAAVAELAMGLILAIDRRIPDNVTDLRRGVWNKKGYSKAAGIKGATLGVLGVGAIGMELMTRAHAFGMRLVAVDRPGRDEQTRKALAAMDVELHADVLDVARTADFLSVHLPAGDDTRGLLDDRLFAVMKPGAAIINTSRGEVIDEAALLRAMDDKGLRAGLDVYQDEPAAGDDAIVSPLASHPNVYGTHHIGASTEQAQDAVAEGVVEVIESFAAGTIVNCVNRVA